MARKAAPAYEDEALTPEEEAAVAEAEKSGELPPPDSVEGDQPAGTPTEAKPAETPAAEQPKPAVEEKPKTETPAEEAKPIDEDAEFAAFLEKNKGKSPDELARLAFQQSKRANSGEARARVATQNLNALADRAKALLQRREELARAVPEKKQSFRDKLKEDPDAATAELHDKLVDHDIRAVDAELDKARFDEAIGFATEFVPDFPERWPKMRALAHELGYSPEEVAAIRDGRDIVSLSLAQIAADLIKGGVVDPRGNLLVAPQPSEEATDPRLTAPDAVKTIGQGGARAGDGTPSTEQALQNLLTLSDEDFSKLPEEELNNILRAAG